MFPPIMCWNKPGVYQKSFQMPKKGSGRTETLRKTYMLVLTLSISTAKGVVASQRPKP